MTRTMFTSDPSKQMVITTCTIDSHPADVFKAYIDPKLIPHWWGPAKYETIVEKLEARPGGQWRFIQRDGKGPQEAFHGVFHTVHAPDRLVFTFEYEGMPNHVLLETVTFEDIGGRTRVTDSAVFQSKEDRDGMVNSGMESGAVESMERLAGLMVKA